MINLDQGTEPIKAETTSTDSIPVLADALKAENDGRNRATVKAAINDRLGALVVAQMPTSDDALPSEPAEAPVAPAFDSPDAMESPAPQDEYDVGPPDPLEVPEAPNIAAAAADMAADQPAPSPTLDEAVGEPEPEPVVPVAPLAAPQMVDQPQTAPGAERPSEADVAISQFGDKRQTSVTDAYEELEGVTRTNEGDQMNVTHSTAASVILYKPTLDGNGHIMKGAWRPVKVRASNMRDAYSHGFRSSCPDCGGHCTEAINSCAAKQRLYMRCPESSCRKQIADTYNDALGVVVEDDPDDPLMLTYELTNLTPEQRVKAKVDDHLRAFHPASARARGIRIDESVRPETASRDNTEQVKEQVKV
jgi:hypothetical protein